MMMTTIEVDETIALIDKKFYGVMSDELERHKKSKCQIVKDYAKELEQQNKMPVDSICHHIVQAYDKLISKTVISGCLDKKYKDKEQQRRAGSGSGPRTKKDQRCPHCNLLPDEEDAEDTTSKGYFRFNAEDYRPEDIDEKDKGYLRVSTEHWYAERNYWKKKYEDLLTKYEKVTKPKKPKKDIGQMGSAQDKQNLLKKAMAFSKELNEQ